MSNLTTNFFSFINENTLKISQQSCMTRRIKMYEKCIIMLCNVALLASHGSLDVDGDHYDLIMNSLLPSPCAQFTLPTKNVRKKRRKKNFRFHFNLTLRFFFLSSILRLVAQVKHVGRKRFCRMRECVNSEKLCQVEICGNFSTFFIYYLNFSTCMTWNCWISCVDRLDTITRRHFWTRQQFFLIASNCR